MPDTFLLVIIPLIAAGLAALLQFTYNALPESWLQDYDFDPKAENVRLARRMRFFPHSIILIIVITVIHICGILFNPAYFEQKNVFAILLMFLPVFPLALIVISDHLNRIIPDQMIVVCIIFSSLGFIADLTRGNLWIDSESPLYFLLFNRILGAIIGAGILFLIAFIGALISGQEAMGQGDIKLIFACGLLTGGYGLIITFFLAFIAGGIFSVPLLIKKRRRIAGEEKRIKESENPTLERRKLQIEKEQISFADDPDYIAFGPFLAMGTIIFLTFETLLYNYYASTILPSLGYIF